jgi:hypothetical protein
MTFAGRNSRSTRECGVPNVQVQLSALSSQFGGQSPLHRFALSPGPWTIPRAREKTPYFAITAAWTGEKELALQQVETGLRAPDTSIALSYGPLRLLPFWDPLRGDPRFEKIVQSLAPKQ